MELELKVEVMITPVHAHKRLAEKKEEIRQANKEAREEQYRRDQLSHQRENNRQLENLNRKFR